MNETRTNFSWGAKDLIGVGFSAFLLVYTLNKGSLDFQSLELSLRDAILLIISMISFVFTSILVSWRMRFYVSKECGGFSKAIGFSSLFVGSFYNAVLPGNLGELIKAKHFCSFNKLKFRTAVSLFISEKFLDGIMLSIISLVLLFGYKLNQQGFSYLLWIIIGIGGLGSCFIILTYKIPKVSRYIFYLIPSKKASRFMYSIYLEFRYRLFSKGKRNMAVVFMLFAFLLGASSTFTFYINLMIGNLPPEMILFEHALLLSIVMAAVFFIPSAPSSVGVMHYGVYSALVYIAALHNIPVTQQLANQFVFTSIIFHIAYIVPEIVVGAYFVLRDRSIIFNLHGVEFFRWRKN